MQLNEIPQSWLIALVCVSLVTLRAFNIDTWTTGALGMIIGYLTGKHIEQTSCRVLENTQAEPYPAEINETSTLK